MGQRTSRTSHNNIFALFSTVTISNNECPNCGANAANGSIEGRRRRPSDEIGDNATQGRDEFPVGVAVEEGIEVGPPPSYEETIRTANCKIIGANEPQADKMHMTSKSEHSRKERAEPRITTMKSVDGNTFLSVMDSISEHLNAENNPDTCSCPGIGYEADSSPDTERTMDLTDICRNWGSQLVETKLEKMLENWHKELQTHRKKSDFQPLNVPGSIEISGHVTQREQEKILGIYYFNGFRNNRPCYQYSKTLESDMHRLWYEIGHWVIGPIFDHEKKKTFIRLREVSEENANGKYEYEALWEQSFLPLDTRFVWNNEISIVIKSIEFPNILK